MIPIIGPWLVRCAIGIALPKWAANLIGAVLPIAAIIGAALLGWHLIAEHYRGQGADKVEARVERDHSARVVEARGDERAIAATGTAIAARVARADATTTEFVTARLREIDDALDTAPNGATPVVAGADPVVFDGGAVRASVNAVVDRANRAADRADAGP